MRAAPEPVSPSPQPAGGRLRRALGNVALALAGIGVALAAGELALRVFASEPEPRLPPQPLVHPPGLPTLHGIAELNRPLTRGIYKGVFHRTNSLGVRGPELPLEPPPGSFRIVLLGDSIAMGEGVEESDTYAARLADLLSRGDPRRRYGVVNLGISGMNAETIAHRFEYIGMRYRPHLVVYGYTLNDIEGDAYRRPTRLDAQDWRSQLERFDDSPSALLRALWPRLVLTWSAFRPIRGSYEWELARNYRDNPDAFAAVDQALDRIATGSRELGVCAVLFVHPILQDLGPLHPYTAYYRQIGDAARARGFHVVIGFDALRGARASLLRRSAADPHPNVEGHRRLAEALRDGIVALPPECLEPHAPVRHAS